MLKIADSLLAYIELRYRMLTTRSARDVRTNVRHANEDEYHEGSCTIRLLHVSALTKPVPEITSSTHGAGR